MVNILNPTPDDPQTIQNKFGLDKLTLELEIMEMTGDNGETINSTIGLSFTNVTVSVPLFLAIDQTAMVELPVGALLQTEYMMPCLAGVVNALEISSWDMTFGTIGVPTSSTETQTPVFQVIQTVFVTLPGSVPAFFDAIIRPVINNMISEDMGMGNKQDSVTCPNSKNETAGMSQTFVDFREFFQQGLPAMLKSLLDRQILATDPETGLPIINSMFIQPMTLNQSGVQGTFVLGDESNPLMDFRTQINIGGLQAKIELRVSDILVQNLDTILDPVKVLETVENDPYLLNNSVSMGLDLSDRPLSLSTKVFFSIEAAGGFSA
jgi:hypothetical protein